MSRLPCAYGWRSALGTSPKALTAHEWTWSECAVKLRHLAQHHGERSRRQHLTLKWSRSGVLARREQATHRGRSCQPSRATGRRRRPARRCLDEYCVVGEVKIGPSVVPTKGSADGPSRAYPTVGPPGRGRNRLVLPSRRRLLTT